MGRFGFFFFIIFIFLGFWNCFLGSESVSRIFIVLYGALVTRLSSLSTAHACVEGECIKWEDFFFAKVSSYGRDAPTPGTLAAVASPRGPPGESGAAPWLGSALTSILLPFSCCPPAPPELFRWLLGPPATRCLPTRPEGTTPQNGLSTSHKLQPRQVWVTGQQERAGGTRMRK